ncbi:S-phase kinase-associated protein 1-like [Drosophila miranda]|uniref:S-phase kinase-associated protein 1-like n=1 Tax=Drosophila miranda TaxID=7229 RepID=UPI0007E80AD0|nr:S-phase kinase-associated protein 1-like [Drosophila miranda]
MKITLSEFENTPKNWIKMISFETKDGKTIRAELEMMKRSSVIRAMCSACPEEGAEDVVIPLRGIRSCVLLKILLWAQFHKDDEEPAWVNKPYPIPVLEVEVQTSDWDKEFLRWDLNHVCAMLEGANYLEINWLMKLCIQKLFFNRSRLTAFQWNTYLKNIQPFVKFAVIIGNSKDSPQNHDWEWYSDKNINF